MISKRIDKLSSILFIVLCLNSILYYEIQNIDNSDNENNLTNINPLKDIEIGNQPLPDDDSFLINQDVIPGGFLTKGFFSYSDTINSPETGEGEVYQWENYEDFISTYNSENLVRSRFSIGDLAPYVNPPADTYVYGQNYFDEYPYLVQSVMYSPVLAVNTTLANKVHYLLNIHRHRTAYTSPYDFKDMDITYKITLYHFVTSDQSTTEITSVEFLLDPATYTTDSGTNYLYWKNYKVSSTLGEYTIPAGDRLKVAYQLKVEGTGTSGHISTNVLKDGEWNEYGITGTNVVWDINDGDYSNTYTFPYTDGIFGVQLYLREEIYPDIDFYSTAVNNSVYSEQQDVNIAVTPGSTSSYRWDGGSWMPFTTSTTTSLPAVYGWHYLEVSATLPPYYNTRVEYFRLGYDESDDTFLTLNVDSSGETFEGGHIFDFSASNVLSVYYSWDGNPSPIALIDPYDITAPMFNGYHTLQINLTDTAFENLRIYDYQFYFDSLAPDISLVNVNDSDYLLGGKNIKIEITDYSLFNWLKYRWDTGSNQTWTYDATNMYITTMPLTEGTHTLRVYVEDIFGHQSNQTYTFTIDNNIFFVDLVYMEDGGHYQGGEDVDVQVQQTNGSVYYSWDGGSETLYSIYTGTFTLNGADALNTAEGLHTLTIRSFDSVTETQHVFNYDFWVDNTAPQFYENYLVYNNTRISNQNNFYFYISDNYVDNNTLIVQYSLNGGMYINFDTRFLFILSYYDDGNYVLDIKAQDLAGNVNITRIYFTIDITRPSILHVGISGLIDDFSQHGVYYVSANPLVDVTVYELDPNYTTYYSWNGGGFVSFNDNFTLVSSDVQANLVIKAIDTVGNEAIYSKYVNVIYDTTPPEVTTLKPTLLKINNRTLLEYNVADSTPYSIESVEYEWDIWTGFNALDPDITGYIHLNMSNGIAWWCDINSYATVVLRIKAADILGNINITEFSYGFDLTPPTISLSVYDGSYFELVPNNVTSTPVPGGTTLWYNSSVNNDLDSFTYYWDGFYENLTNFEYNIDPYSINTDDLNEDGYHNLTVILRDDTGSNLDTSSPNEYTAVFYFFVDDIDVAFQSPFFNGYQHSMLYNDSYEYIVSITDPSDGLPIPGLKSKVEYSQNHTYPMIVQINQINSTSYSVSIWAISVTNDDNVIINVRFYQTSVTGGQVVSMGLNVKTRQGILAILQDYEKSIQYEDYITVSLYLKDNLGLNNQTIEELYINNTLVSESRYDFNDTTYLLTFTYSSHLIKEKGNFVLEIFVKSAFYYDNSTAFNQISFEITPLPVILTLSVANYTVLEGTDLKVTATLTFLNGTPLRYQDITIYFSLNLSS